MKEKKVRKPVRRKPAGEDRGGGNVKSTVSKYASILYLAALLIISLVAFWSLTMDGKIYTQGDNINDAIFYNQVDRYYQETGEIALWNPYIFGGLPNIFHLPKSWISPDFYLDLLTSLLSLPFVFFWLGAVGQFILLRYLKFGRLESFFGSLIFLLAPYYQSLVINGHGTKIQAITYAPWIVWSLLKVMKNQRWLDVCLLVLFTGLQLRTSHYQIVFYTAILAIIFVVANIIRELRAGAGFPWRRLLLLGVAGVASLMIASWPLLLAASYSGDSVRGREVVRLSDQNSPTTRESGVSRAFVSNWSFKPRELLTLIVARAQGGTSSEAYSKAGSIGFKQDFIPSYWGHSPYNGSYYYMGIIVFFLTLLGFFRWKQNPFRWELVLGLLLMLLWSMGTFAGAVYSFSYRFIPFFSNFRTPTTSMSMVYFLTSILAVYGIRAMRDFGKDEIKELIRLTGLLVGIAALLFLAGNVFTFINSTEKYQEGVTDMLVEARRGMYFSDLLWYVAGGVVFLTIVWLQVKEKMDVSVAVLILLLLTVVDLGTVWNRYSDEAISQRDFARYYLDDTQTTVLLKNDPSVYRVFALSNQNFGLPAHIQTIGGGYDMQMNTTMYELMTNNLYHRIDGKNRINWNVLDFMNVKYLVSERTIENDKLSFEISDPGRSSYLYRYKFNKERAFFVDGYQVIKDDIARMRMINNPAFDARRTAILEEEPKQKTFPASRSKVDIISFDLNKIVYTVETENPGLFVMSETYSPKIQQLFLDGEPIDHVYKTNHAIQSVVIPKGLHTIELRYKSQLFTTSKWISNIGFILLYLALAFLLFQEKRSSDKKGILVTA